MTKHGALTVITQIEADRVDALRGLLDAEGDLLPGKTLIDGDRLTTVHYLRWVVLDRDETVAPPIPAALVFATDFDGTLDDHVNELTAVAAEALSRVYAHCEGFPANPGQADLKEYLVRHSLPYAAFYIGHRGRSVDQIRKESDLREAAEEFMDANRFNRGLRESGATAIRSALASHLFADRNTASEWAKQPYIPYTSSLITVLKAIGVVVALLLIAMVVMRPVLLLVLLAVILLAGAAIATLRWKETHDVEWDGSPSIEHVQSLVKREDRRVVVQNQLTHIVHVKPGRFRLIALRLFLRVIDLLAAHVYYHGTLGGIPSIHFARWVLIDGGRRLLFLSNFDGSWENYLGDFIDRASVGLTGIWSNTEGFPKTRLLVFEGATDEERFKNWTRQHQIPTQFWYSANPLLSVENVNNDTAIRLGLANPESESAATWLRRI